MERCVMLQKCLRNNWPRTLNILGVIRPIHKWLLQIGGFSTENNNERALGYSLYGIYEDY